MAKKITIQHYYTTGTTAAPAASALTLGEIAISAGKGREGIYFKNSEEDVVKVLTSGQTYELIEKATSGITTDGAFQMHKQTVASEYSDENKNDVNKYGHVLLHNGDLSGKTSEVGVAAGIGHTHGQYLTNVTPGSGQPIVSTIEGGVATIGLTTGITNQIASGVTAHGWGNHADAGYAKNTDLTAHTGDNNIHVTAVQKTLWTDAATRFNAFISGDTNEALDTLVEIQEFLSGDTTGSVNLISKVNKNTEDIETLKANQFNYVQDVDEGDNYIIVNPGAGGTDKKTVLISHNTAQAEASAVTVSNATGLSFGSQFDILNKIAYDAKGHVVSGSTQTLKLPTLPDASNTNRGVVKLKSGEFTFTEELLNEEHLTTAASIAHGHTEYVTYDNLNNYSGSTPLTISCGTY